MHVLVVWIVCYLESQAVRTTVGKGHVIAPMIDEIISWESIFHKIYSGLNIFAKAIAITFYEYLIIFIYISLPDYWLFICH